MKNKITAFIVAMALMCQGLQAADKDINKLVTGIMLTAAGGLVAYSGFRMVDISSPAVSMPVFTTNTTGSGPWIISTSGTVENTGNVDLKNLTITVYYMDTTGACITSDAVSYGSVLAAGDSAQVSFSPLSLGSEPSFFSVKYRADFNRLYANNSIFTGLVGTAIGASGIFFILDYCFNLTDLFEQEEVKVQLSAAENGIGMLALKSF